jgi:N-acetylneuraminic acid mutarotase
MLPTRRTVLSGSLLVLAAPRALAQSGHEGHSGMYERLDRPGRIDLPPAALQQRVFDSLAPKAANPGRWIGRAPLPLPRSEMAWATALNNRMHLVGGYGEQRVSQPYHHVYDQAGDKWIEAAPLPKPANHVGVAVLDGRLYAIGGHVEQNRRPHAECFAFEPGTNIWRSIRPLPRPFGAIGCIGHDGRIHAIGGAVGDDNESKRSVGWHYAYDPKEDSWSERRELPTERDHTGTVVIDGAIHVVGGRVHNFQTNSNLHHRYNSGKDTWEMRAPLPTARSGHGAVVYRERLFVMGGEGSNRVFGQNEAYDPKTDAWEQYAPMPTPRHGLGAAVIGDSIHVAGGGAVMGGGVQSAVHEAFTLG